MSTPTEVHNVAVGLIVRSIIAPVIESGGSITEIMVLTESVLMGVALMCIKLGGDEIVLDTMVAGVKLRLAELRLKDLKTSGEA